MPSGLTSNRESLIDFTNGHAKDYVLLKNKQGLGSNIQKVSCGVTFLKDTGEQISGGRYQPKISPKIPLLSRASLIRSQDTTLTKSTFDQNSSQIRMSK